MFLMEGLDNHPQVHTPLEEESSLKVALFGWVLLRHQLMTQVFQKRTFPNALTVCIVWTMGEGDCSRLFSECHSA